MFDKNIEAIRKNYPQVADIIDEYKKKEFDKNLHEKVNDVYIEKSIKDEDIVAIKSNGRAWFLNSQYNARKAAKEWAQHNNDTNRKTIVMILGLANGMYAEELLNLISMDSDLLIYEPNTEIFLKVLEKIDLTNVLKDKRVVVATNHINKGVVVEFVQSRIMYSDIQITKIISLPNYSVLYQNEASFLIETFKTRVTGLIMTKNTEIKYSEEFGKNIIYTMRDFINQYSINQLKIEFEKIDLSDIPAVIVAAGPSLDKNVEELRLAKNKCFMIVVDTALNTVINQGIVPDFTLSLDSHKPINLFANEKIPFIPMMVCKYSNYRILDIHKDKRFYMGDENDYLNYLSKKYTKEPIYSLETGGSVSNNAFSLAQYLGFKKIILVGQDLAFTEGKRHTKSVTAIHKNPEAYIRRKGTIYIDDIFGNKVLTEGNMDDYRKWFENQILKYPDIRVIDATEGGALIKGTEICTLKDIIEKECKKEFIAGKLINKIEKLFTGDSYKKIEEEISEISKDMDVRVEKIKEGIALYKKLSDLNKKNKLTQNIAAKLSTKINQINSFVINDNLLSLAAIYNRESYYNLSDFDENCDNEMDAICSKGIEHFESYLIAIERFLEVYKNEK